AFLSVICLLVAITAAQAWNQPTHMVSAAIAYTDLKERSPAILAKVLEVLKRHPQFACLWAPDLDEVSAEDRDLYLLMLAARWSDDVRVEFPEYDRPLWHYVDIPYHPGEGPGPIPEGCNCNLITAFLQNRSTVQS